MRDAGTQLRRGYEQAINTNITVGGNDIPVYYGKVPSNVSANFFILIQEISNNPRKNMSISLTDTRIAIDIIKRVDADVSMEQVEDASDQILQIVKPTARTHGISIAAPSILIGVALVHNDDNRPQQQANPLNYIVSKSLVFNNIIQN